MSFSTVMRMGIDHFLVSGTYTQFKDFLRIENIGLSFFKVLSFLP